MNQFIRFLLSGGLAAILNWGSRFFFSLWMPFELAIVAAFFVGLLSAFIMMRLYVFSAKEKPIMPQASKFAFINMLALAQTLVISVILARWALPALGIDEHAKALAHLVGVLVPVGTSYYGHKFLTFR